MPISSRQGAFDADQVRRMRVRLTSEAVAGESWKDREARARDILVEEMASYRRHEAELGPVVSILPALRLHAVRLKNSLSYGDLLLERALERAVERPTGVMDHQTVEAWLTALLEEEAKR